LLRSKEAEAVDGRMTSHWVSCQKFTVLVKTDDHAEIVFAAPLVRRFLRQPVGNLLNWAQQFGGLRHVTWPAGTKG
jgi:hypothetical protein